MDLHEKFKHSPGGNKETVVWLTTYPIFDLFDKGKPSIGLLATADGNENQFKDINKSYTFKKAYLKKRTRHLKVLKGSHFIRKH